MSFRASPRRGRSRAMAEVAITTINIDDSVLVEDDSQPEQQVSSILVADDSCIDLTSPSTEYVDLTDNQENVEAVEDITSNVGAHDTSVVIVGSPQDSPPTNHRRTRRSQHNSPPHYPRPIDSIVVNPPSQPSHRDRSRSVSSDDDLPNVVPHAPRPAPVPTTPDAFLISCPVCLDNAKEIKRNNSKLMTTVCGHVFCRPCIESSIRSHHCCPVCRKKLKMNQTVVLHI